MNEFYVNLPSNTQKTIGSSRDNTTSEFYVPLPHAVRLTGQWEVSLVEIMYPYSWDNLKAASEDGWKMSTNEIVVNDVKTGHSEQVLVCNGNYENIDHLLAAIKDTIDTKLSGKDYIRPSDVDFMYNPLNRRVVVQLKENLELIISEQIAYMLGFKQRILNQTENLASYPPDMRGGIDSLYIYCDLVQPQIVGNVLVPLLRILPVSGTYGNIVHQVFVMPHYIDVLHKEFSHVTVSIKTDRDLPIPFKFGKTVLKLHFRRKLL